jgi:hypothetical protein
MAVGEMPRFYDKIIVYQHDQSKSVHIEVVKIVCGTVNMVGIRMSLDTGEAYRQTCHITSQALIKELSCVL